VAGAYFSHANTTIDYVYRTNPAVMDEALRLMYGDFNGPGANTSEGTARYGVVNDEGFQTHLHADILDEEAAAFAEGNFWIVPDKLRVTAGLRYSKVDLDYNQTNFGQFSGRLSTSSGTLTTGKSTDKPVTPKVGVQYQLSDDKMVYASASKGFRAGGVSSQISQTICQVALDNLGITAADIPPAFGPDTVRSYELGGKFRLFNRLQLNMAAFRIDPRGNCSGLARAPATSRPIHGHRRPGHRCVHVSVERTKEALLALPEAELTTTLAVHPQHRRHDHPQGAGGLPRRRPTSSRTIWVTIPVRREAPLQGVTAATNVPS